MHGLPEPDPVSRAFVTAALRGYAATVDVRRADPARSFVADFGVSRYGHREPEQVGYQRGRPARRA